MQTKKALQELYGENHERFGTRLAEVADKLVAAHEAREVERMERAEVMDRLAGQGPLIEHAARELEAARKEAMAKSDAPVVSTFEAYCIMRDASKLDASDRVLKTAAHALYNRWNSDPFGVLTLGDLTKMREHYRDMSPSSAVRDVIEKDIVERSGFHTLANIGELSHAADLIRDQAGYEDAVEVLGIGGDSLKDISARSYLRYEAERRIASRLNDDSYNASEIPSIKGALNRVVSRIAQEMEEGMDEPDLADEMHDHQEPASMGQEMGPEGEVYEVDEAEMPHDERTEEMAEIDSPVSGQKLVVELGLSEEQGVEGMEIEPDLSGEVSGGSASLPDMGGAESSFRSVASRLRGERVNAFEGLSRMEKEAQLKKLLGSAPRGAAHTHKGVSRLAQMSEELPDEAYEDEAEMMDAEMGAVEGMPSMEISEDEMMQGLEAPEGPLERRTVIKDPSSGQDLELTLRPLTEEMGPEPAMDPEPEMDMTDEMDTGEGVETPPTPAPSISDMRNASRRRAEMPIPAVRGQPGDSVASLKPEHVFGVKKVKRKKKSALTSTQVLRICAKQGLDIDSIESKVLSGEAVFGGRKLSAGVREWGLGLDDDDRLAVVRYDDSGDIEKVVRLGSLMEFDEVARDFQARVASSLVSDIPEDMLVVAQVPRSDKTAAKRMMAQIWRFVPEAVGDLKGDDLIVTLPKVAERQVNVVMRTLKDVFGVRRLTAQVITSHTAQQMPVGPTSSSTPGVPAPAPSSLTTPMVPPAASMHMDSQETSVGMNGGMEMDGMDMDGMDEDPGLDMQAEGPYKGEAPVKKQPAGQPMKPMSSSMQAPSTGSAAQADFVARHTDPMKGGGVLSGKAAYARRAQLEDMDEGMGEVREPAPPLNMTPGMPGAAPGGAAPGGAGRGMFPGFAPQAPDATQMPIDMGGGELSEDDEDATRAALQHFRNIGLLPLEAVSKFLTTYGSMLDKYGDETSPQRALAEAAVIRIMGEAYQKPAIIPKKRSANLRGRVAEMPIPKHRTQQPDAVKVKMNFDQGDMPKIKVSKPGAPKGKYPDKSMKGHGDSSTHSFGPSAPGGAQTGSQYKNRGVKHPSTSLGKDNSSGSTAFDKHMESLSRSAPDGTRSKLQKGKKSASEDTSLYIKFDDETGTFALDRGSRRIASGYEEFSQALEAAELRRMGTAIKVYVRNTDGTLDEV